MLSKEDAIKLHKELWMNIASTIISGSPIIGPVSLKRHCFNRMNIDHVIVGLGFACQYAYERNNYELENRCKFCPLKFDGLSCTDKYQLNDKLGIYSEFKYELYSRNYYAAHSIAKKIANLPTRSDNENDID